MGDGGLRSAASASPPRVVTREAFLVMKADFDKFNTNKDGVLDKSETRVMMSTQAVREPTDAEVEEMFSSMDLDSNGKISLHEYIAAVCGRGWLDDAGFDAATRKEIGGHLQGPMSVEDTKAE